MRWVLVLSLDLFSGSEYTRTDVGNRLLETQLQSHVEGVLVEDPVVVAAHDDSSNPGLSRLDYSLSPFSRY